MPRRVATLAEFKSDVAQINPWRVLSMVVIPSFTKMSIVRNITGALHWLLRMPIEQFIAQLKRDLEQVKQMIKTIEEVADFQGVDEHPQVLDR
jgi:hypothetical protein